ncbi:MAG: Holliday junction branch migration protein RuvA [Chloroflexota bacterium]|nr:Holliday junction branch migration protein RuvA [Chloroflexota bacterium]
MIASVRGVIESVAPDRLVVQVGGVGLRVLVPATVVQESGGPGDTVHLLTHLVVREDALTLYGFQTPEQLRLFELLIGVTGIGPGHALNILSLGDPDTVEAAISGGNGDFLSKARGLGKQRAARVVLELKNKVRQIETVDGEPRAAPPDSDEVMAAMLSLGFLAGEAQAAIRSLPADPSLTTSDRIRLALAYFNRG